MITVGISWSSAWALVRVSAFIYCGGFLDIVYVTEYRQSDVVGAAYLVATGLPLLLSSQRSVVVLGAIVLAGVVVAYTLYWDAFISVWCYFAAAASVAILFHFEWSRRSRASIANA
jgi:hypothetical protein